jgi:NAD(P)H-dependent flavin oxidoreductase YrpB (nitropropane dioxygenase family)
MQTLKIGDLEARIPVIQGGMGVAVSLSGLASAVANEGGIGIISSAVIGMLLPGFSKDLQRANVIALRREIRKTRRMTSGIIGVNIMMALTDYEEHMVVAVEEGVDLIISGAGLPLKVPQVLLDDKAGANRTKFLPIVSSAKAASLIFRYWSSHYGVIPDGVVVEGPAAGGHLGFKKGELEEPRHSLGKVVPEVVEVMKTYGEQYGRDLPVIAAGGIYTGEDMYRIMEKGAAGVQIATRLVPTHECDASQAFKEAYVQSREEDLMIIESPVGLPGRAIRNRFLEEVEGGKRHPVNCPWKCLRTCDYQTAPYCIALALVNAAKGNLKNGFVFAGSSAYRTEKISSVQEVLQEMLEEYRVAETVQKTLKGDRKTLRNMPLRKADIQKAV